MYFDPATNHFHESPGVGLKLVPNELYAELMGASGRGNIIVTGSDGLPSEVAPPAPVWTVEQVLRMRLEAYRVESDSLKLEAEHDALMAGIAPDYTAWLAKVEEIKLRYPKPLGA